MPRKRDRSGSTQGELVRRDLEFPPFQKQLEDLDFSHREAFFKSIEKIGRMTWQQIFDTASGGKGKRGLNWEKLHGQITRSGHPIAAIRVTLKHRARVSRQGSFMRFISLHPDHDSAFEKSGGEDV